MSERRVEEMDVAVNIAREAGRLTLDWFRRPDLEVVRKEDGSPVTAADLTAETFMRERLAEEFPDDAVIGEEHLDTPGTSGRTWIIDPIDGTKAFTRGVPLYSNLLALVDERGPAIGVINLPALEETVWAGRDLGAFHNDHPCRVSDRAELEGSCVCTSGISYWQKPVLDAVFAAGPAFRTWGDAYGYALVATGRAEAMVDPQAYPWDLAPIQVIISEAGGTFSNVDGGVGPATWKGGSGVATNGRIHEDLLRLLQV